MTLPSLLEIETMGYQELTEVWTRLGLPRRTGRQSTDLMRRFIADHIQRQDHPKTEHGTLKALERALKTPKASTVPLITAGSTLVRDWKGRRHTVRVLEDGYDWEGEIYKSLSKIAHLITGTRWSGPRFFGVKR